MENDQQFCLKWNEHQSTLIRNFDTLLESGALVDCTLAAEGKYLKAHKLVLSACSTYFKDLLDAFYDTHPIVVLKDVKFNELEAMMNYMYRGEVNISESELAALLSVAESLQIKGLSYSNSSNSDKSHPRQVNSRSQPIVASVDNSQIFYNRKVENNCKVPRQSLKQTSVNEYPKKFSFQPSKNLSSRVDSQSPILQKRKKRQRSLSDDDDSTECLKHTNTKSVDVPSLVELSKNLTHMSSTKNCNSDKNILMLKAESLDISETSDEDISLINDVEVDSDNFEDGIESDPGIDDSFDHLITENGSRDASTSSGVTTLMQTSEVSDKVFKNSYKTNQFQRSEQESHYTMEGLSASSDHSHVKNSLIPAAILNTSNKQEIIEKGKGFKCQNCPSHFTYARSLRQHVKHECCQEPKFKCPYCHYRTKQSSNVYAHVRSQHKGMRVYKINLNGKKN